MTIVLVVDDDPAICRTLSINLRARDYEVETAGDGRSALQIVEERMPDVIPVSYTHLTLPTTPYV